MAAMDYSKQYAFHDLICEMLRGPHVKKMERDELLRFIYQAGVALHNIPFNIEKNEPLSVYQLNDIASIDPTSKADAWGEWVELICAGFEQPLPSTKQIAPPNVFAGILREGVDYTKLTSHLSSELNNIDASNRKDIKISFIDKILSLLGLMRRSKVNETLDFAGKLNNRLTEHRVLVESIEKQTALFEKNPVFITLMSMQDDYLMRLFYLRHGRWPSQINPGTGRIPQRPDILEECQLPENMNH